MNECPKGRRYWDTQNDDACRICELRDDCPLEPDDDLEPDYDDYTERSLPDCFNDEVMYE